jgi:hypothetical protein
MGNSTKPRKAHRPKPIVKPLGIRDNLMYEMPALQALEALGRDHFIEQHVYDLLSPADLVKRIAPEGSSVRTAAQVCIDAVAEIQRRNVRNGKPGASGPEMTSLRANVGQLLTYLRGVPNTKIYRAALNAVNEFDRTGVLRV